MDGLLADVFASEATVALIRASRCGAHRFFRNDLARNLLKVLANRVRQDDETIESSVSSATSSGLRRTVSPAWQSPLAR
jgi:hypothetical protein